MTIGLIIGLILSSFGAVALFICFVCVSKVKAGNRNFIFLGLTALASTIWSIGFAVLFASTETNLAYWGRTIGMVGTCSFLIFSHKTLLSVTRVPNWQRNIATVLSFFWIPVFFLTISRNAAIYTYTPSGMTYVFSPGLPNTIYSVFCVIFGIDAAISIVLGIRNAQCRREKKTAKLCICMLIVLFSGMILDTILPTLGLEAIPGSTITQFGGLLALFFAIYDKSKSDITIENLTEYVYSVISEPLLVFDKENKLVLFNRAAREFFINDSGIGILEGNRISDMFDVSPDFLSYEGIYTMTECRTAGGTSYVSLDVSRIRDKYADTIGFVVFVKDMTELYSAMDSLRQAKAEADSANRAKSNFLANMSHEIRTPLNAILGFSELLLNEDTLGKNREEVEDIRDSSNTLLSIVNDILDISKIESGRVELVEDDVKLKDLFKRINLIVTPLAQRKNLSFSVETDANIPSVIRTDFSKLRGIIINIVNNSIKYTQEGSVRFKTKLLSLVGKTASIKFVIEDTGMGMKPEAMKKLFTPFYRMDTKRNSNIEGTGLGLSIVKGYVDLMKGTINVESEYNRGSRFIIELPFEVVDSRPIGVIDFEHKEESNVNVKKDFDFSNLKVLAIDDNRVNLKVIYKCLEKYKISPVTGSSGADAMKLCAEEKYDVILMDQMMPEMDGVETMKRIRSLDSYYEAGGRAKFVCLTANAISGAKEELISAGFDAYVSKPIDLSRLVEILAEYSNEKEEKFEPRD